MEAGTRLGPYEILEPLGAGGMGEVWLAQDTSLGREVAVKVLPEALANDPDTLARFEREARSLAALNHPNIAQVYGLERGDTTVIVMELVEGEDLAARLERGPIELSEVLPIARQIAEALEAAHEAGIVHRDLKPANVRMRPDGAVKVLDFGLAKDTDPGRSASGSGTRVAESPTLVSPAVTGVGTIMGTAAYMSPEQARGRPVDRRADVWAFGCVLFELLSGRRAFGGDDVSMTLASVLKHDLDWGMLPADTPVPVRRMLERCLQVEPRSRYQSIGDARVEIEEWEAGGFEPAAAQPAETSRSGPRLAGAVAAAVIVTAALTLWGARVLRTEPQLPQRVTVLAPRGEPISQDSSSITISPDGRSVAFVTGAGQTKLWIRSMDDVVPREVEGAAGAKLPFWSPDSSRIAFFAAGKLMTAPAAGGRPQTIADAPDGRGGTWNSNDIIVFAPANGGPLLRVSANGGEVSEAMSLASDIGETGHRFPFFLPDGRHFLFASLPGGSDGLFDIYVGALDSPDRKRVLSAEGAALFGEPGYLIYMRRGELVAHPFDPSRLELTGEALPLGDAGDEAALEYSASPATSVSQTGSLAYLTVPPNRLVWLDLTGREIATTDVPSGPHFSVALSRDERLAALTQLTASQFSVWVADLARGGLTPIPGPGPRWNGLPTWSPDGQRLAFSADPDGTIDLFLHTLNSDEVEPLFRSETLFKHPVSWSQDGELLVYTDSNPQTSLDLWTLSPDGDRTPTPFSILEGEDAYGVVSPDGRWMAYVNDRSGRLEAWLQPFPGAGAPVRLTTGGALNWGVWWRDDGRQLLILDADLQLLLIDIRTSPELSVSEPRVVGRLGFSPVFQRSIDASPDLQRLLAIVPEVEGGRSITVVQNWPQLIGAR